MQEQEHKIPIMMQIENNCSECGHIIMCTVFRAFAPLMRKEFEDNEPIDPNHLARICDEFVDIRAFEALKGGL